MKHNERYLYYAYKKLKKQMYTKEGGNLETVSTYLYYLYKGILSPEQEEILEIIEGVGGITPKELAVKMGIGNVNYVTWVCKSMAKKDLLVFVSGKVIITPKGERALAVFPKYKLPK